MESTQLSIPKQFLVWLYITYSFKVTFELIKVTQVTYCYGLEFVVVRSAPSVVIFSKTTGQILIKFGM